LPTIDIPLPAALSEALAVPRCADLRLPEPKTLSISLPTGAVLPAVNDFTRGIPTDCSLAFNLLAQIGPVMGNLHCVISILKLVEPIVNIVTGLAKVPPEPPGPELVQKLAEAVPDAMECIVKLVVPQAGLVIFLRDVLDLIAKLLGCMCQHLGSLADMLDGLSLKISAVGPDNAELLASLACAQENAARSGAMMMASIEPLQALIALAKPLASIAGQDLDVDLSGLGSPESAEKIREIVEKIQPIVETLKTIAQALGGG
jgi:hypothetical protein